MRKIFYKLIALVLATVMLSSATLNVYAAPSRNKGTVKYLSEVILLEATDMAQAKKMVEELKAQGKAYDGVIDINLNKGGSKGVFLAYKSSTNVDDAITDLAVMNMNGDFSMGGYEQLYNQTMDRYIEIVKDYRVMASEFKKNYQAGDRNAITAYRQMNYYYLEKNGVKTYMGDYMLNFPETNNEFAEILFKGNLKIIANIRCLMAMASGNETSIYTRINQAYVEAAKDPDLYNKAEYDAAAKNLLIGLSDMKKAINNIPDEIENIKKDTNLTAEERDAMVEIKQSELDKEKAFYEVLTKIIIGDSNLGAIVMDSAVITVQQLCPIIGAATEAEKLLIEYDTFYELLLYDALSAGEEALDEALAEFEKDYTPISIFFGIQNDLTNGTVGVTGDADISSGTTSENYAGSEDNLTLILGTGSLALLGAGGIAAIVGGSAYLIMAQKAANLANKVALQQALTDAINQMNTLTQKLNQTINTAMDLQKYTRLFESYGDDIANYANEIASAQVEVNKATAALNAGAKGTLKAGQIFTGVFTIVIGVVCMALSIYSIVELHNKYEPKYTEIPDNMVDVVANPTLGDRFINYINVPAYYYDDGKLVTRENDLNAYDGVQWVSLYYTKNYEAGYCLTTTADLIAEESPRSGHTPVHLFGRTSNYNLNSFCGREDASDVFLAFKFSTNKKSAETEIPDIIGSSFNAGAVAISAVCGLGLGFGVGMLIMFKYNKKKFAGITE